MALKAVLESLEGLDASLHEHYLEKDGRFFLDIEGLNGHHEVAGLRTVNDDLKGKNTKLREKVGELEGNLSAFPDDFDADTWAKAKDGKFDDAVISAKVAEATAPLIARAEAAETELGGLKDSIAKEQLSKSTLAALADANVPEEMREAASLQIAAGNSLEMKDGNLLVDTDMGPKTIKDFVKGWVAGPGKWAVPPAAGGDAPGGASQTAAKAKKWGDMTSAEKVALHRENPEEYQRVKEAG